MGQGLRLGRFRRGNYSQTTKAGRGGDADWRAYSDMVIDRCKRWGMPGMSVTE